MAVFTKNWFRADKQKSWLTHLAYLDQLDQPSALEIGSYEGRSALWFLNAYQDVRITCIDPFVTVEIFGRFLENTAAARHEGRLALIREHSIKALAELMHQGKRFDFIYVDGCHEAAVVLYDAVMAFHLLRKDCCMCFDDYNWQSAKALSGPKKAIDAFVSIYAPFLTVLQRRQQLWIRKNCDLSTFMKVGLTTVIE